MERDRLTLTELDALERSLQSSDDKTVHRVLRVHAERLLQMARSEHHLRDVIEDMISCDGCTKAYHELDAAP